MNFNVDDNGNRYFTAFSNIGTYKLSSGVITKIDFSVTGVSSDGTAFGGKYTSPGNYDPGYLGADGSVNLLGWSNIGRLPQLWEGEYEIIDETLYNGSTSLGAAAGRTKLNSSGYSINATSLFDALGNEIELTGSSSAIFTQPRTTTLDLTNTGKVLVGRSSLPLVNDPGNSDPYSYSFSLMDIATQDIVDLPTLPASYVDYNPFPSSLDWRTTSMLASTNDRGDVVAAISRNARRSSIAEIWVFQDATGWLNVTEITGLAPQFLESIEITNGGLISGTYRNPNVMYSTGFAVQAPVPEPGTMLLLAAGVGGLIAARKRKNRV
jgi:hypothetical protein